MPIEIPDFIESDQRKNYERMIELERYAKRLLSKGASDKAQALLEEAIGINRALDYSYGGPFQHGKEIELRELLQSVSQEPKPDR